MAADPVITCLKEVSDYAQFERLCSDLMVLEGYPALQPLGGFKDKGRDAVHLCTVSGQTTIFAYSVREDWRKKLDEDAAKIHGHKHTCQKIAFLCNSPFTPGERDKAIRDVKKAYKWELDLFGLERVGVLLRTRHRRLLGLHPQIFTPAFFPPIFAGIDPKVHDFVFIDYVEDDEVLAVWLARRLLAAGYRPWCRSLSLLAGERTAEAMDGVIRNHACRVLAIYSTASLRNPDSQLRRATALGLGKERGPTFFLPLASKAVDRTALDYQTRDLTFIPFDLSWADGVTQLLANLEASGCPRPLTDGPAVASQTLLLSGVTRSSPEPLYSNCFPILRVPEVIHSFNSKKAIDGKTRRELSARWAFRDTSQDGSPGKFLSFHQPPDDVTDAIGLTKAGAACWAHVRTIEGVYSQNLVMELLRKALVVKCAERGLVRFEDSSFLAFPSGLLPNDCLKYTKPDGEKTRVQAVGERSARRSGAAVSYRYHLAPTFFVRDDLGGQYTALLKVRVQITDVKGQPLPKRTAASRRRSMFKSWYNYEWFSRTLAIASFLADGAPTISIGTDAADTILIDAGPMTWESPVSIDEDALEPMVFDEDEVLPGRFDDDEEHEEEATDDGN